MASSHALCSILLRSCVGEPAYQRTSKKATPNFLASSLVDVLLVEAAATVGAPAALAAEQVLELQKRLPHGVSRGADAFLRATTPLQNGAGASVRHFRIGGERGGQLSVRCSAS